MKGKGGNRNNKRYEKISMISISQQAFGEVFDETDSYD